MSLLEEAFAKSTVIKGAVWREFISGRSFFLSASSLFLLISVAISAVPSYAGSLTYEDIAGDFVAMSIAPKLWVDAKDKIEREASTWKDIAEREANIPSSTGRPNKYYQQYQSFLNSFSTYDHDEVIRRWEGAIIIEPSRDDIVNDQLNVIVEDFKRQVGIDVRVADGENNDSINMKINLLGSCHEEQGRLIQHQEYCVENYPRDYILPQFKHGITFLALKKYGPGHHESLDIFRDCTELTPGEDGHVEGYICSNSSHQITGAECNIFIGHTDDTKRRLVTECLIRGLGFPRLSTLSVSSNLGQDTSAPPHYLLTPYDILMARTLYSSSLRSGTNRVDAYRIVMGIVANSDLVEVGE